MDEDVVEAPSDYSSGMPVSVAGPVYGNERCIQNWFLFFEICCIEAFADVYVYVTLTVWALTIPISVCRVVCWMSL